MRLSIQKLAFVAVLCTGWAVAQQPSQSAPDQPQQAPGQTQQAPTMPGQATPGQNPQDQYPTSQQPGVSGQTSTQTSTGMSSSDIQTKIQSAFQQDPTLANTGITVSVTDDKVQLSGTVPSNAEKDKARNIAESSAGGRKVEDKIKVSGSQTATPPSSPY